MAGLDKQRRSWACDVDIVWKALSGTNTSMGSTEHGHSKQSSKQVYWHILNNRIHEKKKYPWYCEMNEPTLCEHSWLWFTSEVWQGPCQVQLKGEQVSVFPICGFCWLRFVLWTWRKTHALKCTAGCVHADRYVAITSAWIYNSCG